ncbi:hypothetical protein CLAFUW4_12698 [Fulvia fulva]|uniref:Uncharacterized protein n=1 Tax=Passalora fulva TaxID=5499 RepID=A0A9Q8PJQ0_PASFU|nr:uncharacterized protein CLAFUR5_12563 [Fulvia fulva]KAK4611812.1 hypothetical protein CLAFUR4_12703 [Fulvia fulva]KAK4612733.1 hypothetical protein CLAFUR0_12709 [Fulvia fulva]UJO23909.1 hypothetical protein CLAFUR5_12563 [Fulvia fulva]WPV21150.1 hypothetical protein CLAFUW4_12698 [Fulvia fulva]WPV36115.1 hypothetical protein CLAFUW7_12705 [Fulvia fulva]
MSTTVANLKTSDTVKMLRAQFMEQNNFIASNQFEIFVFALDKKDNILLARDRKSHNIDLSDIPRIGGLPWSDTDDRSIDLAVRKCIVNQVKCINKNEDIMGLKLLHMFKGTMPAPDGGQEHVIARVLVTCRVKVAESDKGGTSWFVTGGLWPLAEDPRRLMGVDRADLQSWLGQWKDETADSVGGGNLRPKRSDEQIGIAM